jgi:hypothetical protein
MTATAASSYPATITFDAPLTVARWRVFIAGLICLPHFVVLYALNLVAELTAVVSWFAILFTGNDIEGLSGMRCMALRYSIRTQACAGFLLETYPPFTFATTGADPGDFAGLRVDYQPQVEGRNRVTTFFRILLVIPHLVVVAILCIGVLLCYVIGWFAVLITGKWPEGLRAFIVNVLRWNTRLGAYMYLLTDEYPPFSLD